MSTKVDKLVGEFRSAGVVDKLLVEFRTAVTAAKPDTTKAQSLLTKLKIELTKFSLLPPFTGNTASTKQQLLIARETLEYACLLSLHLKDIPGFTRHLIQLKIYYTDYSSLLPPSPQHSALLGLHLLSLLAHNKLAEFHTELELLSHSGKEIIKSKDVTFAIRVEQQLMEGCYNQVLAASSSNSSSAASASSSKNSGGNVLPHPSSSLFMSMLSATVREKIGECSEQAYKKLGLQQAQQILVLSTEKEVRDFVSKHLNWHIDEKEGVIVFGSSGGDAALIPALSTIAQTLHYATEMEKIV